MTKNAILLLKNIEKLYKIIKIKSEEKSLFIDNSYFPK